MRYFVLIVVAIAFAAPAQADVCPEYRLALLARNSVQNLMNEYVAEGKSQAKLLPLLIKAAGRLDEAERALLANRGDDVVVGILESLDTAKTAASKAWLAASVLHGGSQDPFPDTPWGKVMSVLSAIDEARVAVLFTLCR